MHLDLVNFITWPCRARNRKVYYVSNPLCSTIYDFSLVQEHGGGGVSSTSFMVTMDMQMHYWGHVFFFSCIPCHHPQHLMENAGPRCQTNHLTLRCYEWSICRFAEHSCNGGLAACFQKTRICSSKFCLHQVIVLLEYFYLLRCSLLGTKCPHLLSAVLLLLCFLSPL